MKSLRTLIKLQKTYVDEQRQHLARLQDRLEAIEGQIALLQIVKTREQQAVESDPMSAMTYGAFIQATLEKEREMERERQIAHNAVVAAQEKLAELFEEQKRYEIAEQQRIEAEAKEERRLETIALDEVGGVMHERKKRGG